MRPILFREDATDFNNNGIGVLFDAISDEITEERNGEFELYLEYPDNGIWVDEIKDHRIIRAKPSDRDDLHNFRIYDIRKSLDAGFIEVFATSKTNDLGGNLILEFTGTGSPQLLMDGALGGTLEPTDISFSSDIETESTVNWVRRNPLNCIVGEQGSLVQIFGGEIKRTDRTIYLYGRRGRDTGMVVRQGRHLEGFNINVNTKGLVTRILPFFTYIPEGEEDEVTITGSIVDSPLVDNYPTRNILPVDYSGEDGVTDLQSLNDRASGYFTYQNPDIDKPNVTVDVDMFQLSESEDYEEFRHLETIGLTDTITVYVPKHKVDVELKVTTLKYSSIREKTLSLVAGSNRPTFYDQVTGGYQKEISALQKYVTGVVDGVRNTITDSADGRNRIFRGYDEPSSDITKENDLWYKNIGSDEVELYIFIGGLWEPLLTAGMNEATRKAVEEALAEAEQAKADAESKANQALEDAKAHAEAEDARIIQEIGLEVDGAIALAEQAKADAVTKANQALVDAKAHAEAEDARIRGELESEVDGAIALAEQAKADAVTKANQALEDAKAHADAEILLIETHFDEVIEGVESDVADAKQTADDAIFKIDNEIADKFTSLDAELVDIEAISNAAKTNAQTAINHSLDALEDSGTALDNAQTALTRADTAIGSASTALTKADEAMSSASGAVTKADEAKDAATVLGGQVSGFETTVAGFNQTVNNYTGQVSGFRNDISGLESTVATYATEVDEFGDTVSTYATEVSSLTNTVSGFNSTVATYGTAVTGYKNQVSTFNNTVSGFNSTVANYTTEVNELGEEVESYATEVSTLTNTVSGFQSKVTKVEQDYAGVSGTVATHTTQIGTLDGQIKLKANTTTVTALTGRVSTAETSITANADAIKLKASTSSVNTLTGRVSTAETGITANATAIGLRATSATVNTLTGRVSTAETGITANANAIKLKANTTTVNTLTGRVSTAESNITANSGAISSKVWKTDIQTAVDGIEVGGRNLLKNSKERVLKPRNAGTASDQYHFMTLNYPTVDGQTYTISADVEITDGTFNQVSVYVNYGNTGQSSLPVPIENGKITRTYIAHNTTSSNPILLYAGVGGETRGNGVIFRNIKIEKGNKATDWTPAPEDTTSLINHVETTLTQKHDAIEATVSSVRTDLTGTTTLLNTTRTTVSGHTSSISTLRTDVNGKATTAQFNTLTSTVNGTVTRVGNAEGKITTIETNVSGLQTTVASKASQTQVTQLSNGFNVLSKEVVKNVYSGTWSSTGTNLTVSYPTDILRVVQKVNYAAVNNTTDRIWGPGFNITQGTSINVSGEVRMTSGTSGSMTFTQTHTGTNKGFQVPTSTAWTYFGGTYTALNNNAFSLFFHNIGTYEIRNLTMTFGGGASEGQLSVLNDNINLRVSKNDVVNQINVSTEGILIDGKRTHITGTTKIDNGVIKNAHIGNLDASKINAGTINAARLNASAIVTAGLTTNVVKSTHIETSTATVDKIFATDAMVNRLTAKSAFITSVKAVDISAARITSGTINAARLNASAIVTAGLTANVIKSTHLETSTATITKLFATDAAVGILTAKTAFINSVKAVDISAARITSGVINAARLNASAIVTAGLTANVIKSTHLETSTAAIDKLFATTAVITRLTAKTAFINNIKAIEISADKITAGTIDASKITVINLDANRLTTGTISGGGSSWNLSTGVFTTIGGTARTIINNGEIEFQNTSGTYYGGMKLETFDDGARGLVIGSGQLRMTQNRLETLRDGNRDLYLVPQGTGAVKVSSITGTMYPVHADEFSGRVVRFTASGTSRIEGYGSNGLRVVTQDNYQMYQGSSEAFRVQSTIFYMNRDLHMRGKNITNQSDARLKTDIVDNEIDSLEAIKKWRLAGFNWIDNEMNTERQFSVIAQSAPEISNVGENGYLDVNSSKQLSMTTHAVQQLSLREESTNEIAIQALESTESNETKIHKLQQELSKANRRIEELEGIV